MKNKKGQSSVEALMLLPIVFLIALYVVGQMNPIVKTTIAMAQAKESFYEKVTGFKESVFVEKIEFVHCQDTTLKLDFKTVPIVSVSDFSEDIVAKIETEILESTNQQTKITLNSGKPTC